MAKRAGGAILALAATVALSGCGTTTNLGWADFGHVRFDHLSPHARVYGGVLEDMEMIHFATVGKSQFSRWGQKAPWEDAVLAAVAALLLIDLPVSAVGDTLTLPLTFYAEWKRQVAKMTPPAPPPDTPSID